MPCFISADGKYFPCCFMYTSREFQHWLTERGHSLEDVDISIHGYTKVYNSEIVNEFYKSFDTPTCRRECGDQGYTSNTKSHAKWNEIDLG